LIQSADICVNLRPILKVDPEMLFRWLGVGGIELRAGNQVLLIDPYVTRFPLWRMAVGRVRPNRELIAEKIPRCDFVLVTHPHVDHLLDVPDVVRNTGAVALGSANTCRLLAVLGVPAAQIREIDVGDQLTLGNLRVDVLPAGHVKFWGWRPFSGPLPSGLRPPLRARDYRMDRCFGFLADAGGRRLLHCPGTAVPAEVLTVKPLGTRARYESLLRTARPRIVIPVHWDDFCRPLSKPVRPILAPSGQAVPPLRRIDLARFKDVVEQIVPGTLVLIPEMFHAYDLGELASPGTCSS
jgi:L-ascorbate metabolism protein UlaG (beta-lactamase superfamily)